jgi:hypothetical protein
MVAPLIGRLVGSALAKRGGKEVAKAAPRRTEKFMGMVDEVPAKRLADETIKTGGKSVVSTPTARDKGAVMKGAAAGAALLGGGAAMMSGGKEEAKKPSAASRATGRVRPDETPKAAEKSATRREFEREFKKQRDLGKTTFTFKGESYNTRLDGESESAHKKKMEKMRELTAKSAPKPLARGGVVTKGKK